MKWRNPLSDVRPSTIGIISLTGLWTMFQVLDAEPPPVLDQVLVAVYGIWFAAEAKRGMKKASGSDKDKEEDE